MVGKELRVARIFREGRAVVIAADHGAAFGPMKGIEDLRKVVAASAEGGADAVMVNLGTVGYVAKEAAGKVAVIASLPFRKRVDFRSMIKAALRAGVDAVKLMVFTNCPEEDEYIDALADVARVCEEWGMPLMAEMYPREKNLDPHVVARAARIAFEVGADIVKTFYTGEGESFRAVVQSCPLPILILGGPKVESDEQLLRMVRDALDAGAAGIAFGRNVWQRDNPVAAVKALRAMVHEGSSVEEALRVLQKG